LYTYNIIHICDPRRYRSDKTHRCPFHENHYAPGEVRQGKDLRRYVSNIIHVGW